MKVLSIEDEALFLFNITGTTKENKLLILSGRTKFEEKNKRLIIYFYPNKKNKQLCKKFNIYVHNGDINHDDYVDIDDTNVIFKLNDTDLKEIKHLIFVAQVCDDLNKDDKNIFEIQDNIFIEFIFKIDSEVIFTNVYVDLGQYFNKITECSQNQYMTVDELFI